MQKDADYWRGRAQEAFNNNATDAVAEFTNELVAAFAKGEVSSDSISACEGVITKQWQDARTPQRSGVAGTYMTVLKAMRNTLNEDRPKVFQAPGDPVREETTPALPKLALVA